MLNNLELLSALTERIVSAGADIAPSYDEYVRTALAIATDCGETGREYFYKICQLSPKWNAKNAEQVFSSALTSGRGNVHLATVIYFADLAGVNIKNLPTEEGQKKFQRVQKFHEPLFSQNPCNLPVEEEEEEATISSLDDDTVSSSSPSAPLPHFPAYDWPWPLSTIIGYAESIPQRDVMLLGSLTTLGATLWKYVQVMYSRKKQNPCMQTFIVAPPASGKGVLTHIRRIAEAGAIPSRTTPSDNLKDNIITQWDLSITDADLEAVLALMNPLYEHATHIVSFLPSATIKRRTNSERNALFNAMGEKFSRADLLKKAKEMGFRDCTVDTWLKRMVKSGVIKSAPEYGRYIRIKQ